MNSLANFLPSYPIFDQEVRDKLKGLLPDENEDPNFGIYRKNEFYINKLDLVEDNVSPGNYYKHQKNVARFLSVHTPYQGILLMHDPGTGKTCASVAAVEHIKAMTDLYRGAWILTKNSDLGRQFRNELCNVCTCTEKNERGMCVAGPYRDRCKQQLRYRDLPFYNFETTGTLSSKINSLREKSTPQEQRDWFARSYDNHIIIIDEVHNLRSEGTDTETTIAENIKWFLHQVRECKVILMSGTPMVNQASDIAMIMNMILPTDQQLPTGSEFDAKYLDDLPALKKVLHGRVSYLRTMPSDIPKEFVGDMVYDQVTLQRLTMEKIQSETYMKVYEKEKKGGVDKPSRATSAEVAKSGSTLYHQSQEASNMVFPFKNKENNDEIEYAIGRDGLSKVVSFNDNGDMQWVPGQNFLKWDNANSHEDMLKNLRKYSVKYASVIESILKHKNQLAFVFNEVGVKGSGGQFLAFLMTHFGIKSALITGDTPDSKRTSILKLFNDQSNSNGSTYQVLIGSRVLSEAVTLKNVRQLHVLNVPWHFTRLDQVIARAHRLNAHQYLINQGVQDVKVSVHLYCTVPDLPTEQEQNEYSVELYIYKGAIKKDHGIKLVQRALMEASFDCALNYSRNQVTDDAFENRRECQYQSCKYTCDGIPNDKLNGLLPDELDLSTYMMFYGTEIIKEISDKIIDIFSQKRYVFPVHELVDDQHDKWTCLFALNKLIGDREVFRDVFKQPLFLEIQGDQVFAVRSLIGNSSYLDSYYVSNVCLYNEPDTAQSMMKEYTEFLPTSLSADYLEQMNDDQLRFYINNLPGEFLVRLIQEAYRSRESGVSDDELEKPFARLREKVLDMFANNLEHNAQTNRTQFRYKSFVSVYDGASNKWRTSDVQEDVQQAETRAKQLLNSGVPYLAVIDSKNPQNLKILNLSDPGNIAGRDKPVKGKQTDTRTIFKGQDCTSWKKALLLNILEEFEISHPSMSASTWYNMSEQELDNEFKTKMQDPHDKAGGASPSQTLVIAYGKVDPTSRKQWDNLSLLEKRRAMFWDKETALASKSAVSKKLTICKDVLMEFFKNPVPYLNRRNLERVMKALNVDFNDSDSDDVLRASLSALPYPLRLMIRETDIPTPVKEIEVKQKRIKSAKIQK